MKRKALFKVGDQFFHPEQKLFLTIDSVEYYKNRGGYLYRMKVFNDKENIDNNDPWKSYYQDKMLTNLVELKNNVTKKVLYGQKN